MDGHALILQLCHAKKDGQVQKTVGKDKSSTKLIVRNVAFEATEKELRQLFSPFGQVKAINKLYFAMYFKPIISLSGHKKSIIECVYSMR